MFYASYLSVAGRDEEAIAEIRQNQKLDPLSLMTNSIAGRIFYAARRNDESIVQCRKALELDPTFWVAHLYQGRALEQQGKYSEAIAELRLAGRVTSEPESIIGHAYAMSGNPSKARTVLESLKKRAQTQYVPAAHIARIYAGLGDRPEAFAWLERAFQERSPWVVHIRWDPTFDPIRSDPRFTALLHRVGLQP